ncbi:C40 family peptidase [Gordonia sp. (in: high G+C Gram-positive bacteria)]|uniref:C40 family peptidase n=1 Tax=Gordonia sp. (in: high G+C Gram-positive bacteria) TaxID=84139 RepID=UPI003C72645F
MTAALLIAPLKALVATLGTGVLPPEVTTTYAHTQAALSDAAAQSQKGAATTQTAWRGAGGDQAANATRHLSLVDDTVATAGADISGIVQIAAGHVETANNELNALVESFAAAAATVPAITTPAGLAALVPLALDHLARGVAVVNRAQGQLASDAANLGRHEAAVAAYSSAMPQSASHSKGKVPITLPDGSIAYAPNERAATAVRAALSRQGTPYVWGGTSTDGFDCSGFTQWAYRQAGLELPRLAQDQDTAGFQVSQADLQPGDLAVWSGHVAMYIGNGQLVETGGDPVGVSPLRTTNAGQTFEGFYRPR